MKNELSPIVLFTYNRPLHAQQVLNSLAENAAAKDSFLYIFFDGAKYFFTSYKIELEDYVYSTYIAENKKLKLSRIDYSHISHN